MTEDSKIQEPNHTHKKTRPSQQKCEYGSKWSVNRLFWGLLLIAVGGLILASNFGFVDVKWPNVWRLWPLIVISAGLSIMSFKNIIWQVLMVLLTILSVGAITWVAVSDDLNFGIISSQQVSIKKLSSDVAMAEVNLKTGVSKISVDSDNQSEIAKVRLSDSLAKLEKTSTQIGDIQQIELFTNNQSALFSENMQSDWNVQLNRTLPMSLNIDAGASDINADVSNVKLKQMNFKAGASSLSLKLGSIENNTEVNIDAGASSVIVKIPAKVGVRLKIEGGLSSKQLADLTETSKGIYQSANASSSSKLINITAKVGVSTFTIERY